MTVETPNFAQLLKQYRAQAGLTQEALAEQARLSVRAISDLERGVKHTPRHDTIRLLAAALRLSTRERTMFEAAARRGHDAIAPVQQAWSSSDAGIRLPPLIGRERERAMLERHLARDGPPVLLLAGEPGIGKSRLLDEAIRRARDLGWTVLMGGCQQRGGEEPYAPLLDALKRHIQGQSPVRLRSELRGCAWLVRLLPELADGPIDPLPAWTLSATQEQRLMTEAVGHFLANVAGPAGTLLALDDLQWAGADALNLLTTVLHSTSAVPLRVVGAYRSTEAQAPLSATLADLAHAGLAERHVLSPFTAQEAEQLLDSLLTQSTVRQPALRESALQRAGGVPFYLVSYAQGLRQGTLEGVPWSLVQSIQQQVAVLPEPAQEMLRTAAIAGRRVTRALLAAMSLGHEEELLSALEAACRAGLLTEDGSSAYQFAHDVIREVVESDLSAARRALLHRRVAEALEGAAEGAGAALPVELLAYHYARSDAVDKALLYLEQAGDRARAQYSHVAAEVYYRELIARLDESGMPLDAARLREKLGVLLRAIARYAEALQLLEQAAEEYRAAGNVESLGRVTAQIGWVHADRGTSAEGIACIQPLLEPLEAHGSSHNLADLYTVLARLYWFSGRYPDQLSAAERAVDLARSAAENGFLALPLLEYSLAIYTVGRVPDALQTLNEAMHVAEAAGDYYGLGYALSLIKEVNDTSGDFAAGRRHVERALSLAERLGDPARRTLLLTNRGMSSFYTGDWLAARRDYEEAVTAGHTVGAFWGSVYPLLDLGRLCLAEGLWEEAAPYLAECERIVRSGTDPGARAEVENVLAERDLLAGDAEAARARLTPLVGSEGTLEWGAIFLKPRLAWALLDLGDLEQASSLVDQALALGRAQQQRLFMVEALRVRAMIFTRQGRWDGATAVLEEGLALTRSMGYPYAEAQLLQVYGQMYTAQGKLRPAREYLAAALTILRRLGARTYCQQVEQSLTQI